MICVANCRQDRALGRRGPGEIRQGGRRRALRHRTIDPRRVRDPGSVSQRQGIVSRALGQAGTAGGRSAGQHARRAVRGALRVPQHGAPGREPLEDLRAAVLCRAGRLECQARSCRAGDHAAPQRRPLLVEKNFGRRPACWPSFRPPRTNGTIGPGASPSFVAFVFNMVPYLSHRFGAGEALLVGEPKTVTFSAPPFEPAVHFSGPGAMPRQPRSTREPVRQGPVGGP